MKWFRRILRKKRIIYFLALLIALVPTPQERNAFQAIEEPPIRDGKGNML